MQFDKSLNAFNKQDLLKAAEEEFGETPELLSSSLTSIREWLFKSPHLHSIRTDDEFLTSFLRGCKFSLERTKEKLDNFHAVKTCIPEWFANWDPFDSAIQEILDAGICLPLPGYDKEGRCVILNLPGNVNPSKMKLDDLMRATIMVMTLARKNNEQADIRGFVVIQDLEGIKPSHLTLFDLAVVQKLKTMGKKAWPVRPKGAHILNKPSILDSIGRIISSHQEKKLRERNSVHLPGDLSKLHEELGMEILPEEYGGTNGNVDELRIYWKKEVEKNRDWLIAQTQFKTDEKKRRGCTKLPLDILGMEGSFRKLNVD